MQCGYSADWQSMVDAGNCLVPSVFGSRLGTIILIEDWSKTSVCVKVLALTC